MGVGKNILLIFLSILLVISLIISITILTASSLLYPNIYVDALDESDFSSLPKNLESPEEEIPIEDFVKIPEEEIRVIAEELITNSLSYLRGETEELDLTITIDESLLRKFIEKQIETIPQCDPDEDLLNQKNNLSEEDLIDGEIPLCIPQEINTSEFIDILFEEINIIPEEEMKIDLVEISDIDKKEFEQIRTYTAKYSLLLYIFTFISLILAALIFFIPGSHKKGMMILGINFLIAGVIIVILSLVFTSSIESIQTGINLGKNFIASVTESLITNYKFYGILTIILGAFAIGASIFLKKKKKMQTITKKTSKTFNPEQWNTKKR